MLLILNNIKVTNYLGENILDLETYFDFGFQGLKNNDFNFDYSVFKPHSEENLVVELNVYHKGNDKIVKTINLHITELLADRTLTFRQGYDQNSVVMVSSSQYGLSNLFNSEGMLEYLFLTNNISNIDASWYTFKLAENYEGITLNGNIITNSNTAPFANMFDQIEIIVTDNNTEETLRFQIKIARNLSA